jgi:hypothetical protein
MPPISEPALTRARELINREIGDMTELPEETRNTIANVYYEFAAMEIELDRPNAWPSQLSLAGDLKKGIEQFGKNAAFLNASMETMADIVKGIRQFAREGNRKGYDLTIKIFQDMFKYRIPDIHKKTSIKVSIERPFYDSKVIEISNLWKLL